MKSGIHARYKRRVFRQLPGDISRWSKQQLLHDRISDVAGRSMGGGFYVTAPQARSFRNTFHKGANRKLRHESARDIQARLADEAHE